MKSLVSPVIAASAFTLAPTLALALEIPGVTEKGGGVNAPGLIVIILLVWGIGFLSGWIARKWFL